MPDAPTPAPHVPAIFVKGGGGGSLSAACAAALAALGYEPSDFAPHRQVRKKNAAARKKIEAWDAMTPAEQQANPGAAPSDRERWLADCQSGHLEQNAIHQNVRGDVCSNPPGCRETYVSPADRTGAGATVVSDDATAGSPGAIAVSGGGFRTNRLGAGCHGTPGYMEDSAACMPQQGSAGNRGDGHYHATQSERRDAAAQGSVGDPYDRDQATQHADARTESLLRDHGNGRPDQPHSTTAASGAGATGAADGATGDAGDAAAVADGAATNPAEASPGLGSAAVFAAECINQQRREINQKMIKQCVDREAKYRREAGSPAERESALQARESAERRLSEAQPGTPEHTAAKAASSAASATHTRMQRSACMAQQSAWLSNPNSTLGACVVPNNPPADDPVVDAGPISGGI